MSQFSVVVPNYNYGHLLDDAVSSALAQDGVDLRVLIVDNCSTDDSDEVARRLARRDSRVEYRRNETNQGHTYSINLGLRWAAGTYTVVLCSDDLLAPGALRRVAAMLDDRPDVVLAYGRSALSDAALEPPPESAPVRAEVVPGWSWVAQCCRGADTPIWSPEVVVRTSAQHQVGGYEESLPHTNDTLNWLRVAALGNVCRFDAVHGLSRPQSDGLTASFDHLRRLRERRAAFDSFFAEHPAVAADVVPAQQAYRRSLAFTASWFALERWRSGDRPAANAAARFAAATEAGRPEEQLHWVDYARLGALAGRYARLGRDVLGRRWAARRDAATDPA